MEIMTKAYGAVEIDEKQIIHFPSGLFGFETLREFALLDAEQKPFFWLQSLEVEQIAFVLINPIIFRPDYKPMVVEDELLELGLENEEEEKVLLFSIVTIPSDQKLMTANLQGPVLINRETRRGRQFISTSSEWKVRHNIMDELAAQRNNSC
ncbi:MAG: flagellar assembly protein FliW [Calditrichaeota bacterium]|nr:MAG: flagellar assembly protein FliW [Calditrichota bacterium]